MEAAEGGGPSVEWDGNYSGVVGGYELDDAEEDEDES